MLLTYNESPFNSIVVTDKPEFSFLVRLTSRTPYRHSAIQSYRNHIWQQSLFACRWSVLLLLSSTIWAIKGRKSIYYQNVGPLTRQVPYVQLVRSYCFDFSMIQYPPNSSSKGSQLVCPSTLLM